MKNRSALPWYWDHIKSSTIQVVGRAVKKLREWRHTLAGRLLWDCGPFLLLIGYWIFSTIRHLIQHQWDAATLTFVIVVLMAMDGLLGFGYRNLKETVAIQKQHLDEQQRRLREQQDAVNFYRERLIEELPIEIQIRIREADDKDRRIQ